jgi:hypothetical protein
MHDAIFRTRDRDQKARRYDQCPLWIHNLESEIAICMEGGYNGWPSAAATRASVRFVLLGAGPTNVRLRRFLLPYPTINRYVPLSTAGPFTRLKCRYKSTSLTSVAAQAANNVRESMADIRRLMRKTKKTLDEVANDTYHLRLRYPANSVPRSIFAASRTTESVVQDGDSTADSTSSSFEQILINSKVYRRTVPNVHSQIVSTSAVVNNTSKQDLGNLVGSRRQATESWKAPDQHVQQSTRFVDKYTKKSDSNSLVSMGLGEVIEIIPTTNRDQRICPAGPDGLGPARKFQDSVENVATLIKDHFEPHLDWNLHFKLQNEDYKDYRRDRIPFQTYHWKIVQKAWNLKNHLDVTGTLYSAQAVIGWPNHVERPSHAVQRVFQDLLEIKSHHEQLLLNPLLTMWQMGGAWTSFDPKPFLQFIDRARRAYETFSCGYPEAVRFVQTQAKPNNQSTAMLLNSKRHRSASNLNWTALLNVPLKLLLDICALLSSMEAEIVHEREKSEITETVVAFRDVISSFKTRVSESNKEVEYKHLEQEFNVKLQPHTSGIIFRQKLPVRLSSTAKRSNLDTWRYCDVILLKDCLLIARARTLKPEARHNVVKRNNEANPMEIIEVGCCSHDCILAFMTKLTPLTEFEVRIFRAHLEVLEVGKTDQSRYFWGGRGT